MEEDLQRLFAMADEWFTKFGEVSIEAHQQLKKLLEQSVPDAKKIDYFLDLEQRKIIVIIYVKVSTIMFGRPKRLADNVLEVLKECLSGYEISVEVQRLKKAGK